MARSIRMILCAFAALLLLAAPAGAAKTSHRGDPPPDQTSPLPNVTGCDPIDPSACMLPFPNDLFTKADPTTPTGRRVDFSLAAMPRNTAGKPIDPTDWNRADGFSPGSLIVAKVPGLDTDQALRVTGAPPITDPAASLRPGSPVVVLDADTGKRQMVWAELDHSMDNTGGQPSDRVLLIRPAKNLLEGHRYIVALREMKDAQGNVLKPSATFAAYRDKTPLANPIDEQRRAHFESLFATLGDAHVDRGDLYLAWDFTVASEQSLAGRMLAIRNDAFHQLGDDDLGDLQVQGKAPTFTLTRVTDYLCDQGVSLPDAVVVDGCPGGEDGPIAYDVKGTMDVPCYMDTPGCAPAHSQFVLDPTTNLPKQVPGNVFKVDFRCRIPKVALDHPGEARPSLYGHGLLGSRNEIGQGQLKNMMAEHDFIYCATNWAGMASEDLPNVASILTDLSHFNTLADRVQQGMLNFLYLGRLMIHPDGLSSSPLFRAGGKADGAPLLDTRRLYYDGNSQGGIIGGSLIAVAPDLTRGTLGVLGMNYSTLLTRSTDFGRGNPPTSGDVEYAWPLYQSYPQRNERQLIFSLMQMLWDRAEADGYAQHMTTDPYPDTPAHQVMLMAGYGDHQVANVAAEVEARTIGARVLKEDMLRPWRPWEVDPWPGLKAIDAFPARNTSVFTIWDGGSRPVPLGNIAQDNSKDDDPHEWVRNTVAARAMKSAFLAVDSQVLDTCTHVDPVSGETVPYCDTDTRSDSLSQSPFDQLTSP